MTDNVNKTDETYTYFTFSFMNKSSGIIGTLTSEEETKAKITSELEAMFGPDNYEITEFRPATDEELEEAGLGEATEEAPILH